MNKIWVISDMHLGDDGMTEPRGGISLRPEGFSEKILAALGHALNPSDVLIDLGDTVFGDAALWAERLKFIECKKWLVLGNHDKKSVSWYLSNGWDMVCESFKLEMFGERILFSHIPQKDDGWYSINIHGHFHDFPLERVLETEPEVHAVLNPKHFRVSLEDLKYGPITLKRVMEMFGKRKRETINLLQGADHD